MCPGHFRGNSRPCKLLPLLTIHVVPQPPHTPSTSRPAEATRGEEQRGEERRGGQAQPLSARPPGRQARSITGVPPPFRRAGRGGARKPKPPNRSWSARTRPAARDRRLGSPPPPAAARRKRSQAQGKGTPTGSRVGCQRFSAG